MTALEMQQLFETELQTTSALFNDLEKPDTDTIFRYINDAQKITVKELYDAKDYTKLKNIISNTNDLTPTGGSELYNSVYYTFSDITTPDFLYYINSRSKYDRTLPEIVSSENFVYNEEVTEIEFNQFLTTAFNKPFFRIPKCYIENNVLRVISDAYTTITGIIITYVKNPVEIEIDGSDCELDESIHRYIVDKALQTYIQYKTLLNSNKTKN